MKIARAAVALRQDNAGTLATVTIKTVAERARVSAGTVSRVLNGKAEAIRESTRQRVLDVVRELNYVPHGPAASLRRGTTHTVGLVVPDIADSYFHLIARGLEDIAQEHGYTIIFCNTDRTPTRELRCLQMLLEKRVDAIIFAGAAIDNDKHLANVNWGNAKVVTIGPHRVSAPSVGVDNRAAIRTAIGHLVQQGCRQIACIAGKRTWLISQTRLDGYRDGLTLAGLKVDSALIWPGDLGLEAGRHAVEQALHAGLDFDGIIAFNDYCAVGAMQVLREAGIAVPEQVAVVGCDDIPLAVLVDPPLSSIAFPLYDFGVAAMRIVLDLSKGQPVPTRLQFNFALKVRRSSTRRLDGVAGG